MSSTDLTLAKYMADAGLDGRVETETNGNIVSTHRVYGEDGVYVIQHDPRRGKGLGISHAVLRELEDSDVPVPNVEYFDSKDNVLVTESIGEETLEDYDKDIVYRQMGQILADIHNYGDFSMHGPLAVEENSLNVEGTNNWRNAFQSLYEEKLDNAENFLDKQKSQEVESFYNLNVQHLPLRATASLLHMDYKPDNIVAEDKVVKGVIDWDQAIVGDPDMEFFQSLETLHRINKPVEPFQDGYTDERTVEASQKIEELYRLHANITFLSAMYYQDEEKNIDISDRNTEYSLDQINSILS